MSKPGFSGSFWRGVLVGGTTLLVAGLLWQGLSQPPAAYGQIPDSGAQRQRMIREMGITNQKLSEIADLLRQIRDRRVGEPVPKKPQRPAGRPEDPPPSDPRWP